MAATYHVRVSFNKVKMKACALVCTCSGKRISLYVAAAKTLSMRVTSKAIKPRVLSLAARTPPRT